MIVRVRTPSGHNGDIDLGPSSARMKAQTYHLTVATIPNAIPVLSAWVPTPGQVIQRARTRTRRAERVTSINKYRNRLKDEERLRIVAMRSEGMSQMAIARAIGRAQGTVSKVLRAAP